MTIRGVITSDSLSIRGNFFFFFSWMGKKHHMKKMREMQLNKVESLHDPRGFFPAIWRAGGKKKSMFCPINEEITQRPDDEGIWKENNILASVQT